MPGIFIGAFSVLSLILKRQKILSLSVRWRFGSTGIEVWTGIDLLITEKLQNRPVVPVGARSHIDNNGPAQSPSEFRRQHVCEHLEFGDGVWIRQHRRLIVIRGVVVN